MVHVYRPLILPIILVVQVQHSVVCVCVCVCVSPRMRPENNVRTKWLVAHIQCSLSAGSTCQGRRWRSYVKAQCQKVKSFLFRLWMHITRRDEPTKAKKQTWIWNYISIQLVVCGVLFYWNVWSVLPRVKVYVVRDINLIAVRCVCSCVCQKRS